MFCYITACSGRIRISNTYAVMQIQSPNYPLPYPNNLDCRWLVESTLPMTTLVAITTSYNVSDDNDVLTVKDGGSRSSNQLWSFVGALQGEGECLLSFVVYSYALCCGEPIVKSGNYL